MPVCEGCPWHRRTAEKITPDPYASEPEADDCMARWGCPFDEDVDPLIEDFYDGD
jgi:hypothetical protein